MSSQPLTFKFNLPLDFSRLQNDRLKLVPIEENIDEWADLWVKDYNEHPRNWDYFVDGPTKDGSTFVTEFKRDFLNNEKIAMFAVILKAGTVVRTHPSVGETETFEVADGTFAGLTGMMGEPDRATADLGAMLLTRFHRTFVGTHANGLVLHHLLDSHKEGGLGLRRTQWQCNADNAASVRMAKRIGFQMEGIVRWQQILALNKFGSKGAEIDREGLPKVGWDGREWGAGRHTALLSLCWDDWQNGGRDKVDALMKR